MYFQNNMDKITSLKEYIVKGLKHKIVKKKFCALNNISFSINKQDSVALVGLNGSGKSTILKIISGILKQSKGKVEVRGHISPLIELGTGLDPELTARENIFLNGALLGYNRQQMEAVYDYIVDFSELHEFMNAQVKNFSSGMISRLAFSIATANISDILIIDEILSVGDFKFQKKCIERIKELKRKGITILFVSHSQEQIKLICDKVIWLEFGKIKKIGDIKLIIDAYENNKK